MKIFMKVKYCGPANPFELSEQRKRFKRRIVDVMALVLSYGTNERRIRKIYKDVEHYESAY